MRNLFTKPILVFFLVLLVLLAVRVPFFLTGHIQEDAYISFRCAENLAETGVYGYNPGERVSASTAHLYVFLVTLIRLIAGEGGFIAVMQVINTLFLLLGAWFIARVFEEDCKQSTWLWIVLSLLPVSLMISYAGMETALLIFLIGAILYSWRYASGRWFTWLLPGLMPWVRPDAVGYGLTLLFWRSVQQKKVDWRGLISLLLGGASWLLFNKVYFGNWLTQSITAKALSTHAFTLSRFWFNLRQVFAENVGGIFNPLRTKYFDQMGYLFLLVILAAGIIYLWQHQKDRSRYTLGWIAMTIAFAIPVVYASTSVVFPWYVWPSTFFGYTLLVALVMPLISISGWKSRVVLTLLGLALVVGIAGQWIYSYSWGMKERYFRGGIGEFIAARAEEDDTLLLEPAGYIPYFAGVYTYDEVGLVSPLVVYYRQLKPETWWGEFLHDVRPVWVVQRDHILEKQTYQGYAIRQEDWKWFKSSYDLVAEFHYDPQDYANLPWQQRLLGLGETDDYYLYKLKE